MHYRHAFHAGNFADVFKHVLLCGLVLALNRKGAPWTYLETHAGAGGYRLQDEAQRTGEFREGVARLMSVDAAPLALSEWLDIVRKFNRGAALDAYPGSPWFVRQLAREQDRLVLCERVEGVFMDLRMLFAGDSAVALHRRDGYELPALLPPQSKRALVLIDPPFESPTEFEQVATSLIAARKRFSQGIYAVWYPLKKRFEADRFCRRMGREADRDVLDLRFETGAPGEGQMRGCGVLIVNPPYRFEEDLAPALDLLKRLLAQGSSAGWQAQWLNKV
ncbi:23S rRNA (adenine(2030)-N(6))-methyltransferase RlmJ [Algiphilus sp. W345]|uniref:Ribosomal RNA large subunit methyltransferase J n=1 Tax=Banduia mediterranea TaxID=3075609 RepID=A0ABU2WFM3_9GAMM|nr:23S rRNA (adenine(2030)-N(6))-methyltransferase RlmJ [Algiphilus sp. W345]MDT0496670.1 23S rRNA (adenine(2030)-N(6))-methyltransferase RlmJ [Algiphilus sp. W345]